MEQQLLTAEELPEAVTEPGLPPVYTEQNTPAQLPSSQSPAAPSLSQQKPLPAYYQSVPVVVHIDGATSGSQTPCDISASCVGGKGFPTRVAKGVGGAMIGLFVITLIFAVMASGSQAENYEAGAGYWCGIVFLFAGSVGVHAGRTGSNKSIIVGLVSSTLSWLFAITLIAISGAGLNDDAQNYWNYCYDYSYGHEDYRGGGYYNNYHQCGNRGLQVASNAILVAMGVIQFGLSCVMVYVCARTVISCSCRFRCIRCKLSFANRSLLNVGEDSTAVGPATGSTAAVQMQVVKLGIPRDTAVTAARPQVTSCGSCSVTPCQAVNPVPSVQPCSCHSQFSSSVTPQKVCSRSDSCRSCQSPYQHRF